MSAAPARSARILGSLVAGLLPILVATTVVAQESGVSGSAAFSLGPAFPNPFVFETRIPFVLEEELFGGGRQPLVSMRVYNLLHQLVGYARLGTEDGAMPLDRVPLPRPGRYEAAWDGRDLAGEQVTEGPYFIQISVDGRTQVRKVLFVRRDVPDEPSGSDRPVRRSTRGSRAIQSR